MIEAVDAAYLLEQLDQRPSEPPLKLISGFVENVRVLPPGTPFPGPFENRRTQYNVEVIDNLSPYSPIQRTIVMKSAQLGVTAAAENVIAYYMAASPSEILLVSATEDLLSNWASKRLEPLIDSIGFRARIAAQFGSNTSRRAGDKVFSKEYPGGALNMASAQSASSLRSDTKRVLIRDEIDGAPPLLKTGEGSWMDVSWARTLAWGERRKVLDFSTPTTYDKSLIWEAYQLGDQRKYNVPCPHCDHKQELEWLDPDEKKAHGLKPIYKGKVLDDVVYVCVSCHQDIKNYQKSYMIENGEWVPTAVASSPEIRSYQISSLYSPQGMMSWKELWGKYLQAKKKPEGMASFTNLYLGMPYKPEGKRPQLESVLELKGGYTRGTVPDGVLFLTVAGDVQRGSATDPNNPPRIEIEICGHGGGYRTWSIDYWRIEGDVDDPFGGAWAEFSRRAEEMGLTWYREDGTAFSAEMIFLDSGDGQTQAAVEAFCEGWRNTYPIKGFQGLKRSKKSIEADETIDARSRSNYVRYRPQRIGQGEAFYYQISTNYYKTLIYNRLNSIPRQPTNPQRPGFMDFPSDYEAPYFRMLTAEEKMDDGSFTAGGRRNEALDVRVYNLCAADVYLDSMVKLLRKRATDRGARPNQLENITKSTVLEIISKNKGVEFPYGEETQVDDEAEPN